MRMRIVFSKPYCWCSLVRFAHFVRILAGDRYLFYCRRSGPSSSCQGRHVPSSFHNALNALILRRIKRRVPITRNVTDTPWNRVRNRFESNQILLSAIAGKRCSLKRRGVFASILGTPYFLNLPYGITSHC